MKYVNPFISIALSVVIALAPWVARADRGRDDRCDQDRHHLQQINPLQNIRIVGMTDSGQQFTGALDIERFEAIGNQIVAVGQLNGRLGNFPVKNQAVAFPLLASTGATGSLGPDMKVRPARGTPVAPGSSVVFAQATCPILHLSLAPLDLNLLGLVVHLNQVVLNLDALAGAGNLLGNLLCAVANLLDAGGLIADIVNALNGLTSFLNGIGGL
jgi:hypothetical protein